MTKNMSLNLSSIFWWGRGGGLTISYHSVFFKQCNIEKKYLKLNFLLENSTDLLNIDNIEQLWELEVGSDLIQARKK